MHPSLEALQEDTRLTARNAMRALVEGWKDCARCPLHETAGDHHVFVRGTLPCDLLFIAEAPSRLDAETGKPLSGGSGQMLNLLLRDLQKGLAEGDKRKNSRVPRFDWKPRIAITTVVACRPLDDGGAIRTPTNTETIACAPRLLKTIQAADPSLGILRLGIIARTYTDFALTAYAKSLPENKRPAPILDLWHPAYIITMGGIASITYKRWRETALVWLRARLTERLKTSSATL